MIGKVRILEAGIRELNQNGDVAAQLGVVAEEVKSRVRAPSKMQLSTRWGVGPRGAFSQVMMRGSGALAIEFGTRRLPPMAPLRRALMEKR